MIASETLQQVIELTITLLSLISIILVNIITQDKGRLCAVNQKI